ncbi:MAG: ATP-binding protein [Coriobacteriia bacterium]|nr:ATP-binding protein [Coriobacteriia bacterium]
MRSPYDPRGLDGLEALAPAESLDAATSVPGPAPALIAVYDAMTAPPRVERVEEDSARALIESLSSRTYQLSHEPGGEIPYTVIREVVENFIHAGFDEVVVSILDGGRMISFADQGPGIRDKDRVFLPGFTTATTEMKYVIKGVGSGLPVARECLTFSGGTIAIDDNLGSGTVVTLRMNTPVQAVEPDTALVREEYELPALSLRQKQVLSLAMELGSIGPSIVSRELGVGLSTAYRDLEQLAGHELLSADNAGKRMLTDRGVRCLDAILGR